MSASRHIQVTVNDRRYDHEVEPRLLLVDFLREFAGFTGTRIGCDTSSCGACTVIIDGRSAKSCTWFAVQADGRKILTVEGLAQDGSLHPVQEAFQEHHALQCGFCTSGMLMSSYYLLTMNLDPSEQEIREAIAGNLCRCTGYVPVVEAVKSAANKMKTKENRS